MKKIMNPSESMTREQVGKIQDILGAGLLKAGFEKEPVQQVIQKQGGLVTELVAVFRKYVEAVSKLIIRLVNVNRGRTPQKALEATGRKQYADAEVVMSMPKGEGKRAEVIFFNIVGRYLSDDELEKEYELRGLKPADPYSLSAVNEDDSAFGDVHPNCTHWKDENGKWCYAAFARSGGDERNVHVDRCGSDWSARWWFAGLRK